MNGAKIAPLHAFTLRQAVRGFALVRGLILFRSDFYFPISDCTSRLPGTEPEHSIADKSVDLIKLQLVRQQVAKCETAADRV